MLQDHIGWHNFSTVTDRQQSLHNMSMSSRYSADHLSVCHFMTSWVFQVQVGRRTDLWVASFCLCLACLPLLLDDWLCWWYPVPCDVQWRWSHNETTDFSYVYSCLCSDWLAILGKQSRFVVLFYLFHSGTSMWQVFYSVMCVWIFVFVHSFIASILVASHFVMKMLSLKFYINMGFCPLE